MSDGAGGGDGGGFGGDAGDAGGHSHAHDGSGAHSHAHDGGGAHAPGHHHTDGGVAFPYVDATDLNRSKNPAPGKAQAKPTRITIRDYLAAGAVAVGAFWLYNHWKNRAPDPQQTPPSSPSSPQR